MIQIAKKEFELPRGLAAESKVWIYQAERELSNKEVAEMTALLNTFVSDWAAHGKNLQADFRIFFNRFICLFVDETGHGASGCSIDASVHFIQQLERTFSVQLMKRTQVAYLIDNEIQTIEMNELSDLAKKGQINSSTLVFNNLVKTMGEMEKAWILPAGESWHARLL